MTQEDILTDAAIVALSISRAGNIDAEHSAFIRLLTELKRLRSESTCSCGRVFIHRCCVCDNDE